MKYFKFYKNLFLSTFFLCGLVGNLFAQQIPSPSSPPRLINDFAALFSAQQTMYLENELRLFSDSTSTQITIVTTPDLQGYDVAQYAYEIGEKWGVGNKKNDNGVVILIKPKNESYGEAFIAVGYGLEGALPDAVCKQIIENEMIPEFKKNDYYTGLVKALRVIIPIAAGEFSAQEYSDKQGPSPLALGLGLAAFLFFIVFMLIMSRKNGGDDFHNKGKGGGIDPITAMLLGGMIGRGGSFGNFSGGGGSFGGFGGGSFGGGGAGGRW